MADSKRKIEAESREVKPIVHTADGKFVGCGNEACYCDGSCREDKARDLTIKVTADVNDAITGFKSLSRELREATKALREYEAESKRLGDLTEKSSAKASSALSSLAEDASVADVITRSYSQHGEE